MIPAVTHAFQGKFPRDGKKFSHICLVFRANGDSLRWFVPSPRELHKVLLPKVSVAHYSDP